MIETTFRKIACLIPAKLLPAAHSMEVNVQTQISKRIEFNTAERRELLAKKLTQKTQALLDKYSPIRKYVSYARARTLKEKKRRYHELIGQITLTHAAIEQNLKAVLVCDWEIIKKIEMPKSNRKKKVSHLFGRELIEAFILQLEGVGCPENWVSKYRQVLGDFAGLSLRRNKFVKTLSGHDEGTQQIIQVDQLAHNNMKHILHENGGDFSDFLKQWIKVVHEKDLEEFLRDLESVANRLQELRSKIFLEKHELYWSLFVETKASIVPFDAYKNPYKYARLHIAQ